MGNEKCAVAQVDMRAQTLELGDHANNRCEITDEYAARAATRDASAGRGANQLLRMLCAGGEQTTE